MHQVSAQTTYQRVISTWSWDITSVNALQITSDGGLILAGRALVKTDTLGSVEWATQYGGDFYDVKETPSGDFIAAGMIRVAGASKPDLYLARMDNNGAVLWAKAYGDSLWECARSVQITQDGGCIVAGWIESIGSGSRDGYVIRTDSMGDTLWTRIIGNSGSDDIASIIHTADGNFALTGCTDKGMGDDVFLIKLNGNGDTLWTRTYGWHSTDVGMDIIQTSDGGFAIIVSSISPRPKCVSFIIGSNKVEVVAGADCT